MQVSNSCKDNQHEHVNDQVCTASDADSMGNGGAQRGKCDKQRTNDGDQYDAVRQRTRPAALTEGVKDQNGEDNERRSLKDHR
jgi:hypothetical protein